MLIGCELQKSASELMIMRTSLHLVTPSGTPGRRLSTQPYYTRAPLSRAGTGCCRTTEASEPFLGVAGQWVQWSRASTIAISSSVNPCNLHTGASISRNHSYRDGTSPTGREWPPARPRCTLRGYALPVRAEYLPQAHIRAASPRWPRRLPALSPNVLRILQEPKMTWRSPFSATSTRTLLITIVWGASSSRDALAGTAFGRLGHTI